MNTGTTSSFVRETQERRKEHEFLSASANGNGSIHLGCLDKFLSAMGTMRSRSNHDWLRQRLSTGSQSRCSWRQCRSNSLRKMRSIKLLLAHLIYGPILLQDHGGDPLGKDHRGTFGRDRRTYGIVSRSLCFDLDRVCRIPSSLDPELCRWGFCFQIEEVKIRRKQCGGCCESSVTTRIKPCYQPTDQPSNGHTVGHIEHVTENGYKTK